MKKEEDYMKNTSYVVRRENIYVGQVIKLKNRLYRYENGVASYEVVDSTYEKGLFTPSSFRYNSSTLFVPNKEKVSDDLLYNRPSYPVLNVTDDDTCLQCEKGSIVVDKACNLNTLLKYFGYAENLSYEDILKIRQTLFSSRFAPYRFQLMNNKALMSEYIVILERLRDHTLAETYGMRNYRMHSFSPVREEGRVKKLTKF